jgi:hypothetical protein
MVIHFHFPREMGRARLPIEWIIHPIVRQEKRKGGRFSFADVSEPITALIHSREKGNKHEN